MTIEPPLRAADPATRPVRLFVGVLSAALLLVACSAGAGSRSGGPAPSSAVGPYPGWPGSGTLVGHTDFIPLLVSAELGVGHDRVLITVQDAAGRIIASPDMAVTISFYDLADSADTAASHADGTFRWLIPDTRGIYVAYADLGRAGDWGLEVSGRIAGQPDRTSRITFSVRETTQTPAIGADAPPSATLTTRDPASLVAISTDQPPDPAFYALSIRDAIAAGKPFVVVFATPAYCTSGTCGPALDLVKQVAADYIGRVNFVHVEPYRLETVDGRTQPKVDALNQRQPVRAVVEWGLPTEPYVFVVDAQGKVSAKFEGMAYPDELAAALDAVLR